MIALNQINRRRFLQGVLVLSFFIICNIIVVAFKANHNMSSDLLMFYRSAHAILAGTNIYQPVLVKPLHHYAVQHPTIQQLWQQSNSANLNMPSFYFLISPLALLSYRTAYWVWGIMSLLLAALSVWIINRTELLEHYPYKKLALYILMFACFPLLANILLGQVGTIISCGVIASWYLCRRGFFVTAGLVLGLLATIKLFIGLFFIYFIFCRQWRMVAAMIISFLLIFICTLPLVGQHAYLIYFANLHGVHWFQGNWNGSLFGYLTRLFGGRYPYSVWSLPLLKNIIYVGIWLLLSWKIFQYAKQQQTPPTMKHAKPLDKLMMFDLGYAFCVVAMLFLSPLGWVYYFPVLLLPLAMIWHYTDQFNGNYKIRYAIIVVVFLATLPSTIIYSAKLGSTLYSLTAASSYFYALLILILIFFYLPKSVNENKGVILQRENKITLMCLALALLPSMLSIIANAFVAVVS